MVSEHMRLALAKRILRIARLGASTKIRLILRSLKDLDLSENYDLLREGPAGLALGTFLAGIRGIKRLNISETGLTAESFKAPATFEIAQFCTLRGTVRCVSLPMPRRSTQFHPLDNCERR